MKKIKKKKLNEMFDNISNRYDLINHLLSLGMDIVWRKNAIVLLNKIKVKKNLIIKNILDLATGTGDFILLLANTFRSSSIVGLDPSKKMLKLASKKIEKNLLINRVRFIQGFSHSLPFKNETFDLITISFGLRNFQYINLSMREIFRTLKYNGILEILEFSYPSNFFIKKIYSLYSNFFIRKIGRILSGDNNAYNYLEESIKNFNLHGKKMKKFLKYHKFHSLYIKELTFKITSIYISKKYV
ncbi:bifunctional demethylmenaquinone methyltransferase/2-methoxy-6-polyprenyl-1,4-benzoquinol methylase UbiE [Blattabacterium cuenoti]|uniref:bifunctional demethylmenaquinone methyltransferase/2-methoxy-6-polyprenyl-1,4-benzoquinol methylase UbiE n=1 Tax=Blattabacterium cuenoti TaxID=1653831 RepID=UPI00163B8CEC|nr:bifunctional demethylmenaquinone methyltransferase/2-methoxy-6-polyprenyl-1,4-benzoquinol methylase UbiE [Blattabacterium cuenoti]